MKAAPVRLATMELSFAAPLLLWALLAAALPVLFHIRARSRERSTDFPGAFFLQNPAQPSAERRRRLEDVVLVVLRCLLLGLAICALAGPRLKGAGKPGNALAAVLTPWSGGPARESEAAVLVLDDSPSVSLRLGPDGERAWPVTLKRLEAALQGDPRRRVAIETSSGRGWPFAEPAEWSAHFAELAATPAYAPGDRPAALSRAIALLKDATADRRIVVLVTDGGLSEEEGSGEALAARWSSALKPFEEPGAPALVVTGSGAPVERQWLVEPLTSDSGPLGGRPGLPPVAGAPFQVRATVRALAGSGSRRLRVTSATLTHDAPSGPRTASSQVLLEKTLTLAPGEVAEVRVPVLAAQPGALWITAQLEGADELPFETSAEVVVQVHPKRQAVLWDLRAKSAPGADTRATTVPAAPPPDVALQAALAALDPLSGSDTSRVRVSPAGTPRPEQITPGTLLVILHGPRGPAWSQDQSERLRGAIEAGASLVWVPDLTGAPEDWPPVLPGRAIVADPLLPRALEGAEEMRDAPPRTAAAPPATVPQPVPERPAWRIGDAGTGHPLLRPFAGGRNGDLEGVRFKRRLRLSLEAQGAGVRGDSAQQILARFDDGLPALVYWRVGAGAVCQLAFGIEPQGGLAESPAWPVLMAECTELASDDGLGPELSPALVAGVARPAPWPVTPRGRPVRFSLEGPWVFAAGSSASLSPVNQDGRVGKLALHQDGQVGKLALQAVRHWDMELPAGGDQLALPPLPVPGLYRLRCRTSSQSRPVSSGVPSREREEVAERWAAARVSGLESSLERLPAAVRERLDQAVRTSGGRSVKEEAELRGALFGLRPGAALAPWLWLLFGVAMALELGFQVWRKRMG